MSQLVRTPSSLLLLPAPITSGSDRDRRAIRYPMISDPMISDPTRGVMSAGISDGGGGSRGCMMMNCRIPAQGVRRAVISSSGSASGGKGSMIHGSGAAIALCAARLSESGNEHVNDVSDDTTILQVDQVLVAVTGNQALNPISDHTTTVQVNKVLPAEFYHQDLVPISDNTTIVQAATVLVIEPGNQALNPVSDDTTTIQVNKVLVAEFEHQDLVPISDNTTTVQPDGVLQIKPAADGNNLEEEYDIGQIELLQERIHKKDYTVETLMRIKPRKPMSAKQMAKIGWDVLHEMEKLKVATALDKATTLPPYVQFLLSFFALDKAKEHIRTVVYSKLKRVYPFKQLFEHWERLSLGNTALGASNFLQVRLPGGKAAERKEGGTVVD